MSAEAAFKASASIDIGLKTTVTISGAEFVDASLPMSQEIAESDDPLAGLLRRGQPIPMVVPVKEDIVNLPVASAIHPSALARNLPTERLRHLYDPFFRANPQSSELVDLIAGAVPGADRYVAARDDFKREQRAAFVASSARK